MFQYFLKAGVLGVVVEDGVEIPVSELALSPSAVFSATPRSFLIFLAPCFFDVGPPWFFGPLWTPFGVSPRLPP